MFWNFSCTYGCWEGGFHVGIWSIMAIYFCCLGSVNLYLVSNYPCWQLMLSHLLLMLLRHLELDSTCSRKIENMCFWGRLLAIELPVAAGFVESAKFWGRFGGMGRHVLLFFFPTSIYWIRFFFCDILDPKFYRIFSSCLFISLEALVLLFA